MALTFSPFFPSCIILMNQPRLRNSLGYETETRRAATTKTLVHHLGSKCRNYAVSQHTLTKMARISWIILPSSIPKYQENWLLLQKSQWGNFLPFNFPVFLWQTQFTKSADFAKTSNGIVEKFGNNRLVSDFHKKKNSPYPISPLFMPEDDLLDITFFSFRQNQNCLWYLILQGFCFCCYLTLIFQTRSLIFLSGAVRG